VKVSPKFEIKCSKCNCALIVPPSSEDSTEPLWPDDWLRFTISSTGGGSYALCVPCKKSFWTWIKEAAR
jgi:hypothetical protein